MFSTGQPYRDLGVNYRLATPKTAYAQTLAFSSRTAWLQGKSRTTTIRRYLKSTALPLL